MRGLIVCDSYHGNALAVAEALADELRGAGHEVTVVNLHRERLDLRSAPFATADFLGLGGPTRMSAMSRRLRSFAKRLRPGDVAGRPLFVFDTYGPLDPDPAKNVDNRWLFPGGGEKVRAALAERGVEVWPEVLRCLVADMKGPLVDGALEEARAFARRFAAGALC